MSNNIKVSIKGKNINNYIKWLLKQKINIYKLIPISYKELHIIIDKKDLNRLKTYSKTYTISILSEFGKLKLISYIKGNIYIIISIIISIIFLYILSNIIFSIDIISNNKEMIEILDKELKNYNIKKYKFKKKQSDINKIEEYILEKNHDILEWLEITKSGTKYIIKLVERKKEKVIEEYTYQSITASKSAIITDIRAYNGEKIKKINDYITKNEVGISGILTKPDNTNIYLKAKGYIYGEVWYKIEVEYPYTYHEERLTGNHKNVLSFNYLNKKISLFPYKKYKEFKIKENNLLKDIFNIFRVSLDEEHEEIIYDEIYTKEEAINKAKELAKDKILKGNNKIIGINNIIILNKEDLSSKIKINFFVSVEEDITKIVEIKKEEIVINWCKFKENTCIKIKYIVILRCSYFLVTRTSYDF